jgi:hypothetical protein
MNDVHDAFELQTGISSTSSARERPSLSIDHDQYAISNSNVNDSHGVPYSPKVDNATAALL